MHEPTEAEPEDGLRFLKSLQELRGLRSQIHYAADYCEKTFLQSQDKPAVMDNTKEYICRAVVTVIDHLGNVSSNLNCRIQSGDRASETERRINCLKQKLLSHERYNHAFVLSKLRLRPDLRRYNPRYILPPAANPENTGEGESEAKEKAATDAGAKPEFETEEDTPLFMYTSGNKVSSAGVAKQSGRVDSGNAASLASVLPVRDALWNPTKARNPSFHFQNPRKHGRKVLSWKPMQDKEFLSLIRRTKRELSKLSRA